MALQNPGGAANIATSQNYIETWDLLEYRNVDPNLYERYPDDSIMTLVELLGGMQETTNVKMEWAEADFVLQRFAAGNSPAAPGGTNDQTIQLAVADHYNNGTLSYPRVGQMVEYPNGAQGQIVSKSTVTPNAHTVTIRPKRVAVGGAAVKTLPAVTAGDLFILSGFVGAEGTTGTTAITPLPYQLFNQLAIIKENHEFTGTADATKIWFTINGQDRWTYKGEQDAVKRYKYSVGAQILTSEYGFTTDADGNTVRHTEGWIPSMKQRSNVFNAATFDYDTLKDMFRALDRNKAGKQFIGTVSYDFHTIVTDVLTVMQKNDESNYGFIGGKAKAAMFGFNQFVYNGMELNLRQAPEFSEINGLGSDAHQYKQIGIITPLSNTAVVANDSKTAIGCLQMHYLRGRKYSQVITGFAAGNSRVDTTNIDMLGEIGAKAVTLNRSALVY